MALFKYYKLKDKLLKPDGPLSRLLSPVVIYNYWPLMKNSKLVRKHKDGVNDTGKSEARSEGKRGPYSKLSAQIRAE